MFEVAMKYLNETGNKTLIHLIRQRPTPASYVAEVDGNHLSKADDELLELAYDSLYADLFAQKKQAEQLEKLESLQRQHDELLKDYKDKQQKTDLALFELASQVEELLMGGGER